MGRLSCNAADIIDPGVLGQCFWLCTDCVPVADLPGGGCDHSDHYCGFDTELLYADGRRKYIRGYPGGKRINL